MKLIDKYLLREYLTALAYCLAAFTIVQVVYDLFYHFSKIMAAGITFAQAIRYYLCYLMQTIEYVIPASILLGTLYTLWQMTRHGELTAMRASGISFIRLMVPFLAVGIVFSLLTTALKETVGPDAGLWAVEFAENGFKEPEHRIYHNQAHYNTVDHRVWIIEELDIKHPRHLKGVKVTQERADGGLAREWYAQRAEWLDGQWWFFGVRIQNYNWQGNPIGNPYEVPGSEAGMAMPFTTETPAHFVNEVKDWQFLSAHEMVEYLQSHPQLSRASVYQKRADLHLRLAMPWACIIVTLFGIPAGARSAREGVVKGVLFSILCFFVFYAMTQVGIFLGKRQLVWPWLGAWLANIVFLATGVRMLVRMR
jgi:lipopolysaccharide export system permease protein